MFGKLFSKKKAVGEFDFAPDELLSEGGIMGEESAVSAASDCGGNGGMFNRDSCCEFINMVPFEWSKPVVADAISKKINREVFKRIFFYAFLFIVFAVFFGGVSYYETAKEKVLDQKIADNSSALTEYEAVAENLSVYKTYIEIPNNPAVYTQFYGISFLSVRNGFLVGKLSFASALSGETSLRVNRDGFAIETGKRLEDIKVAGVWTLAGTVSPRAGTVMDSNWSMNFSKQVSVLFGRQGLNAYTRVSAPAVGSSARGGDSSDMVVTILLWK